MKAPLLIALFALLVLLVALFLGRGDKEETPAPVDEGATTVVTQQVVILGESLPQRFQSAFEAEAAARETVELEISEPLGTDPERQREKMQRWAARGVDLFAIAFWDRAKAETVIAEANAAGIPVLIFGSETADYSGEVAARIAADPYRSGQLAGMTMIHAVGESPASLGLVDFSQSAAVQHRIRGIEDSLGRFSRSRLERGPTLSKTPLPIELLESEEVGGLFVFSESRVGPTADALEKVGGQAQTSVIGFGSGTQVSEALERGRLHALIQPSPDALAKATFLTIDAVLSETEVEPVQWVKPVARFRD